MLYTIWSICSLIVLVLAILWRSNVIFSLWNNCNFTFAFCPFYRPVLFVCMFYGMFVYILVVALTEIFNCLCPMLSLPQIYPRHPVAELVTRWQWNCIFLLNIFLLKPLILVIIFNNQNLILEWITEKYFWINLNKPVSIFAYCIFFSQGILVIIVGAT